MARTSGKGYGRNNVVATGSDSGDQVSVNAWNDDKDAGGMLGFTSSTKTISSGAITPIDTATVVAAETSTTDNLDFITYSDTMENDILYLFADTGDTITVRHNQSPASGKSAIITTSAASVTLSETVPLVLQRRSTTFYQIIENSISSVTAGSSTVFTNKSIDLTDNTLTGTSLELKTAISDETGSGSLVFATSPTFITPVLGTPAAGSNLTNCTFPTLNQSTTGNADTATTSTNVTVADESTDTSCNVLFTTAATGDLPPKSGTNLTFNSNTGILTATGFAGPLTGNVTGDASGSSGSCTGNSSTATTAAGLSATLAVASGGTGSTTASASRTALGVEIGSDVQAYNSATALTTNKISDFAATTSAELAGTISDETGSGALVFGTAPTITLANGTGLPAAQVTAGTLQSGMTIPDPTLTFSINTQTGTAYTPVLADSGKIVTLNNGSAIAVTIPLNSSVSYPVGSSLTFISIGAGLTTISGAVGVTIASAGGTSTAPIITAQHNSATAIKIDTDVWQVVGALT